MAVEHKHKALTCSYSLNPTPINNYYQCYAEYDEGDGDNTIITSNLKENRCENSGAIAKGIILRELNTFNKNLIGRVVDPVHMSRRAKRANVSSVLKTAEALGIGRASVSSSSQSAAAQTPVKTNMFQTIDKITDS